VNESVYYKYAINDHKCLVQLILCEHSEVLRHFFLNSGWQEGLRRCQHWLDTDHILLDTNTRTTTDGLTRFKGKPAPHQVYLGFLPDARNNDSGREQPADFSQPAAKRRKLEPSSSINVNNSTFADVLERLTMEDKTGAGEFSLHLGPSSDSVPSSHSLLSICANIRLS
jgi:hypothetical protein